MTEVFFRKLGPGVTERDLRRELLPYGPIQGIQFARNPPGFAFVVFQDANDAHNAIRDLNGKYGWEVMLALDQGICFNCGEPSHLIRDRSRGR